MKTVAVDFDGVIHQYHGWDGNPPKGKPVPGVTRALHLLKGSGHRIVCFTARDALAVQAWLKAYKLDELIESVTNIKPPEAVAFFDDRAYRVDSNRNNGLGFAVREFLQAESKIPKESLPSVSIPPRSIEWWQQ